MTSKFQHFQGSNCLSPLKRTTVSIFQGKRFQADILNLKNIRFVGRPRALSAEVTIKLAIQIVLNAQFFFGVLIVFIFVFVSSCLSKQINSFCRG